MIPETALLAAQKWHSIVNTWSDILGISQTKHLEAVPIVISPAPKITAALRLRLVRYKHGKVVGIITQFPQPARSDTVVEVQLYAERLTFSTGPHVFQMVHWNMANRENTTKTYHRIGVTRTTFPMI